MVSPLQKLTRAEVVVVGKVTAIEKDVVTATPHPDVKDKLTYKVAVIKIETGLVGAANVTHVKVGFIPPPPADPARPEPPAIRPGRGGFGPVHLTEGQEGLFYLTKHHSGEFYTINPLLAPTDSKAGEYKDQVAFAKRAAAALADPMKALKAEKADERSFAAIVVITRYRTYPESGGEVENVKVPADESKLLLKALAEAKWKPDPNSDGTAPNGYAAFAQLGLINDKDGWKYPMVKPGEDFIDKTKEAFVAWLAGPGKDYQISKLAPKKK
jgi:hypothetical protein